MLSLTEIIFLVSDFHLGSKWIYRNHLYMIVTSYSVHNLEFTFFCSQNSLGAVSNAETQRRPSVKSTTTDGGSSTENSLATVDLTSFKENLVQIIQANKDRWKELAAQGMLSQAGVFPPVSTVLPYLQYSTVQNDFCINRTCSLHLSSPQLVYKNAWPHLHFIMLNLVVYFYNPWGTKRFVWAGEEKKCQALQSKELWYSAG